MRVLDLFSGIGGFSLGLERAGMTTVAFCEIDPFCRAVLKKHWPHVPQFEDIKKLRGEDVGSVDVVCGGYPCQPFSTAGKRGGAEDDRHLWPEMFRIIKELGPAWVIGENVAGHITMGLDHVLSDLEELGYSSRAFVIPACAVDAKHRRDRVWIIANAHKGGKHALPFNAKVALPQKFISDPVSERGRCGDAKRGNAKDAGEPSRNSGNDPGAMEFWLPEPAVGRVANGIPNRVDRLRALGNAVVPQIPELIGRAIMEAAR